MQVRLAEATCTSLGDCILNSPSGRQRSAIQMSSEQRTVANASGYQPGGADADNKREQLTGVHDRWPAISEYVSNDWPRTPNVATRLQEILGIEFLGRCVGMNAIFFRAPSKDAYEAIYPPHARTGIQTFCVSKTLKIVQTLNPERVVIIADRRSAAIRCVNKAAKFPAPPDRQYSNRQNYTEQSLLRKCGRWRLSIARSSQATCRHEFFSVNLQCLG